jgi:hypothetical protein
MSILRSNFNKYAPRCPYGVRRSPFAVESEDRREGQRAKFARKLRSDRQPSNRKRAAERPNARTPNAERRTVNGERRRHFAPSVGSFVPFTIIGRCSTDKTDRLIFGLPKTAGNPNGKRYINKVIFNNESLGYAKRRSF